MPYRVKKRKCKNSQGKKGKYIITKKNSNKKISCHTSKSKADSVIRAKYANEDIQEIAEKVFIRLLYENIKKEKSLNGSHPEEYYLEWHDFEKEWFDKKGLTTWDEDRKVTYKYLKDMGLLK